MTHSKQRLSLHMPSVFLLPFWLLRGIAYLKAQVAGATTLSAQNLPYRADFLHFLTEQKASGRRLVLATAAHRSIAQSPRISSCSTW